MDSYVGIVFWPADDPLVLRSDADDRLEGGIIIFHGMSLCYLRTIHIAGLCQCLHAEDFGSRGLGLGS